MDTKLSIIVPTLDGDVPASLMRATEGRTDVEVIVVKGVTPVGKARSEGLRQSTGKWIAWVDADDEVREEWLPTVLCEVKAQDEARGQGADILTFNARQEWHDGSGRPSAVLDGRKCGQLWCKVFRRVLFNGLEFQGAVHEDWRMQCQMPRDARRKHIDKVLYVYQRRANGLSQHHDARAVVSALWGLIKICNSWEMAKGIWERIWDFAKTPLRRMIRR